MSLCPGTISCFFATNLPDPLIYVKNLGFGWFSAISLPHVTHCANEYRGGYMAWVCARVTISYFFATNMPNPLLYFQNSCLGWFRTILLQHVTHCGNEYRGAYKAWVCVPGTISCLFATNMPNPLLWVQNSCFGWFRAISLPHVNHCKNEYRGAYKAWVCAPATIACFFATNTPNPLL